jgi:hypothetical protein
MLELAADRYLAHLSQLQDINADSKPIDRMIVVIRWFLAAFADLEVRFRFFCVLCADFVVFLWCSVSVALSFFRRSPSAASNSTHAGNFHLRHTFTEFIAPSRGLIPNAEAVGALVGCFGVPPFCPVGTLALRFFTRTDSSCSGSSVPGPQKISVLPKFRFP